VQKIRPTRAWAVLFLVGLGCGSEPTPTPPPTTLPDKLPDIAIIVVDTLRADATIKAATPGLDSLAANGLRIPFAWSPSTWTAPSTLSLMTGTHVRDHGWDLPFPRFMSRAGVSYPSVEDRTTLAEVMKAQGYRTVGLYANPLLSRTLGWERGYDVWQQVSDGAMNRALRQNVRHLKQNDPDRPLLAYLHLLGPHQPIRPSRAAAKRWGVTAETRHRTRKGIRIEHAVKGKNKARDQYIRAYHAQIEDTDGTVSQLVEVLERRERPLMIIVTSDHGELLGEHDTWGHETSVWNQLTHVPLILSGDHLIPAPDVLSTAAVPDYIATALGIEHDWPVTIDGEPILVSQRDGAIALSGDGHYRGVWETDGTTLHGVYDVRTDPEEQEPIPDFGVRAMLQLHRGWWMAETPNNSRTAVNEALDAETRSLLEELGYMGHGEPDEADQGNEPEATTQPSTPD